MNIDTVTKRFGSAYRKAKTATANQVGAQKLLFEAFDDAIEQGTLAQIAVTPPFSSSIVDMTEWLDKHYPGYRIHGWTSDEDGPRVVLEEDPRFMSHTHTNHKDGWVYGRDRTEKGPTLDEEEFQEAHPEIWEKMTAWPEPLYSLLKLAWAYSADDLEPFLVNNGVKRVFKGLDDLNDNDLSIVQDHMLPGAVGVRLRPPREIKPEEMANAPS